MILKSKKTRILITWQNLINNLSKYKKLFKKNNIQFNIINSKQI